MPIKSLVTKFIIAFIINPNKGSHLMKYKSLHSFYLLSTCLALIVLNLSYLGNSTQAQIITTYSAPILLKESLRAFAGPQDLIITPDGGYLLVADTGNNEIKVLQPGTLNILGQFGTGYLKSPSSIKIDKIGIVLVMDDENKRVTSFRFKGMHRNGTVNVQKIKHRSELETMQVTSKSTVDEIGQNYIVNSAKSQIEIFNNSGDQIGIYRGEGIKNPMSVETVGSYFWVADTGNNRILLFKAPRPSKL